MKKLALSCFLAAFAGVSAAHAVIICVAPTSTTDGSLQITAPIDFNITATSTAFLIDLSSWVTSDGSQTLDILSPDVAFALNGAVSSQETYLVDNLANTVGDIKPNDGYLIFPFQGFDVTAGDTLTLLAGTYVLGAVDGFNPQTTQTFTGDLFVTNGNGVQISDIASAGVVPEPSTWAVLGFGVAGASFVALRRRQRAV